MLRGYRTAMAWENGDCVRRSSGKLQSNVSLIQSDFCRVRSDSIQYSAVLEEKSKLIMIRNTYLPGSNWEIHCGVL
jgi:hypothetical protein